jgi:peptidylprolyl isomerase/peptidyl-prolyl cis-trans isomerase B (cyclophilin B)
MKNQQSKQERQQQKRQARAAQMKQAQEQREEQKRKEQEAIRNKRKKIYISLIASAGLIAVCAAVYFLGGFNNMANRTEPATSYNPNSYTPSTRTDKPRVQIEMENGGIIVLELYPHYAPETVRNFVGLVEEGFYDGIVFHRIVDGFMAQGGCPYGQGFGGSGQHIDCETINNGWAQNTLSHTPGVISMAHAGTNTGSSQFFLMLGDAPWLDGQHAGFGRVAEGFEIVQALQTVPRTFNQNGELATPMRPVTITSMARLADAENGNPRVQVEIHYTGE